MTLPTYMAPVAPVDEYGPRHIYHPQRGAPYRLGKRLWGGVVFLDERGWCYTNPHEPRTGGGWMASAERLTCPMWALAVLRCEGKIAGRFVRR